MAKDAYYFPHDYNARGDRNMVRLFSKYKLAGIGAYWCIVEMLYEEGGYIMLSECDGIAFELRTKSDFIKDIILNSGLFENDGAKFWSESALRRLKKIKDKSKKASENADKRWNKYKGNANDMQTHSKGNAIKGNKKKENKRITPLPPEGEVQLPFGEKFKTAWSQWLEYKLAEHRFKYKSAKTQEAAIKDLIRVAGNDEAKAIQHIEYAIAHTWKGFYEIKEPSGKQSSGNQEKPVYIEPTKLYGQK